MSFKRIKCAATLNPFLHSKIMHTPEELQLIEALYNEYTFLCHDDFDPDEDPTPEQYLAMIKEMTYDELIEEACIDNDLNLDTYLEAWG